MPDSRALPPGPLSESRRPASQLIRPERDNPGDGNNRREYPCGVLSVGLPSGFWVQSIVPDRAAPGVFAAKWPQMAV